ncbi:DEAD/DEAH box helicase family protein [Dictyobacter formicarum]|uniref:Helicase ATP-binding domain-containing protein n=1 Tax=Dictyobacter formicarum TaxID=2778368 RepID=A0ABQ3VGE6_9CHLR|nr:DEAD/DEAH box helicase family protein [Dictyobacter formicarum]GHO85259.1 hypothetical protein KSZ_32650 [Dictyobacter formicarum]
MPSEAQARIKINKLLEDAGWRLLDTSAGKANVVLEKNVKLTKQIIDEFGNDFEKTKNGYIDYLLLDERGFPFIVLEAKKEEKSPLDGKEQAREYAQARNVRYIILSNGREHYFWDIKEGNPYRIGTFPSLETLKKDKLLIADPSVLANEAINTDYIVLTQLPDYQNDPSWKDDTTRQAFIIDHELKFLRKYQLNALYALQNAAKEKKNRYLFEMATGTGKTLTSAAVIKLFLKTGQAKRVLFLVDRIELEDQAQKNFVYYLSNDYICKIYKENRSDWDDADIVVSTVQTLTKKEKYKRLFTPTDFDLIISDEAHRSISGNGRAVFEYFYGYKLGLTATPKDYLNEIDIKELGAKDPRALEKRYLLDTYTTFGCENQEPTYRYSLLDGVADGFLVSPIVVDARTDITTQLLSDEGFAVAVAKDDEQVPENDTEAEATEEKVFYQKDFEKRFFSENTNKVFCTTFLKNALKDPISGEIGKTIIFCITQNHASKITQMLNEFADEIYPGKYNSDFAVQITSNVSNAQQFTTNFANNNLNGSSSAFLEGYKTSKTRVCITVGMMTTGYDCKDILNLCLMKPIFSPTEFVQIKGRGTREHTFIYKLKEAEQEREISKKKEAFKLIDFFAVCEFFEKGFEYNQALSLPKKNRKATTSGEETLEPTIDEVTVTLPDELKNLTITPIGLQGMRVDRELFRQFKATLKNDPFVQEKYKQGEVGTVEEYVKNTILDKPEEPFTLEKLRESVQADRKISLREMIENIMQGQETFKSKDQLLEEEYQEFIRLYNPENQYKMAIRNFLKAYITDVQIRDIVAKRQFTRFATNPKFTLDEFKALGVWRNKVIEYVNDKVQTEDFA